MKMTNHEDCLLTHSRKGIIKLLDSTQGQTDYREIHAMLHYHILHGKLAASLPQDTTT